MEKRIEAWLRCWGLAAACVVAPLLFGVLANGLLAGWLSEGSTYCAIARDLPFSLIGEAAPTTLKLSADEQKTCNELVAKRLSEAAPVTPVAAPVNAAAPVAMPATAAAAKGATSAAAKGATSGKEAEAKGPPPPPHLQLVANHIAGRLNVAYAYAFLLLVSAVAATFGSYVLIAKSWRLWAATLTAFVVITIGLAIKDLSGGGMRRFVADNVLTRADAHALLQFMPAAESLRSLIVGGLFFGYLSVGLVLAALFMASVRRCEDATLEDLKERLFIIRVGLILGSAILVVVVLSSRAVFDWPLSLLAEPDRKALAPAADALVRKWGAIGSIALIAAFLPAITAWYLDRDAYRNSPHPAKHEAQKMPDEGELEIAPIGMLTSILAVLGPVLASPIFDVFKSLFAVVQK